MSIVKMVTSWGEEHGLINILTNSVVFDDFKHMSPEMKEKCKKEKKHDAELVKVKYINMRGKNERLEKHYCRWAGDRIEQWKMIPNQVYEVPRGFVTEVNDENRHLATRSGLVSVDGKDVNGGAPLVRDSQPEVLHVLTAATF